MRIEPRIVVASVFGLSLVGLSLYWSLQQPTDYQKPVIASVVNTEGVRSYIPVYDEDDNKIPDWQDAFDIAEVNLDGISTSTPYVPNTRTGELAIELARTALAAETGTDPEYDPKKVITDSIQSLKVEALDEQYTNDDVYVGNDDSIASQRVYGNRVAQIIFDNAIEGNPRDELTVLNDALTSNNPEVLEELDSRIESYKGMVADMKGTAVPPSLVREHLSLLNVYQALLNDIEAFRNVFEDAIPSMMRFRRYMSDATALYTGIVNLYEKLNEAGIQWNESDPASQLIVVE